MVSVYRGTTSFGSGDTSLNANIGATVDTSKAFILTTGDGENTDTERCTFSAVFNSSTQITLTRGESGTAADVTWQVIEATQGEFEVIDSGTVAVGSGTTTTNETITDVGDTGQCTVFISANCASADDMTQQQFTATLTSTTNLQLVRQTSGSAVNVVYWVIKWHSSVNVYNGTASMTGTSSTNASIGGTVTLAQTVLFFNYNSNTNGLAQSSVLGYLDTTTTYFTRESASGNNSITWSVVEFPSQVVVQSNNESGTFNLGSAVTSTTATISSVTTTNTMIVHSNMCTGTGTAFCRNVVSNFLTNSTTITFECNYTGQTRDICYYAVDFSAWSLVTTQDSQVKSYISIDTQYSKESRASLPTNPNDLSTLYSSSEISDVGTDDGTRVSVSGAQGYVLHQYRDKHTNGIDTIDVEWNGQVGIPPSRSTVFLQIYNHNSASWETLDSDNSTAADTDFTLTGTINSNQSFYYDAQNYVACRIYQQHK